jgi:hypothetical protein
MAKNEEFPVMRGVKKGSVDAATTVVIDEDESDMQPQGEFLAPADVAQPAQAGRTRIVLEENDDIPPTGLFVGLNGTGYLIRPGEPVDVPSGVIEILDNATTMVPQVDPQTRQVLGYRPRMRFAYRRVA